VAIGWGCEHNSLSSDFNISQALETQNYDWEREAVSGLPNLRSNGMAI
jgi:hypothetical protein